uniref:Uncharacterized protein n=1 Tax=Anopheles atroparvus TaxID=41427 RepID=A0A182IZ46_ANOAO
MVHEPEGNRLQKSSETGLKEQHENKQQRTVETAGSGEAERSPVTASNVRRMSGNAEPFPSVRLARFAAILVQNSIRLPLAGLAPPRVLMCSASMGAEGSVTLQLREAVPAPDATGSLDGALTIGYPDSEMLADMLGTFQGASTGGADSDGGSFDLLQDTSRTAAEQIEHILTKSAVSSSSSTGSPSLALKPEAEAGRENPAIDEAKSGRVLAGLGSGRAENAGTRGTSQIAFAGHIALPDCAAIVCERAKAKWRHSLERKKIRAGGSLHYPTATDADEGDRSNVNGTRTASATAAEKANAITNRLSNSSSTSSSPSSSSSSSSSSSAGVLHHGTTMVTVKSSASGGSPSTGIATASPTAATASSSTTTTSLVLTTVGRSETISPAMASGNSSAASSPSAVSSPGAVSLGGLAKKPRPKTVSPTRHGPQQCQANFARTQGIEL